MIASFRVPGLLFSLVTAVLFPWYAVVLIIVFLAMRLYYAHRFHTTYPTLAQG
jgi:hypothetical protein